MATVYGSARVDVDSKAALISGRNHNEFRMEARSMPRQKKANTFMVSLTFASGMNERTEEVEEAIREFVSSQPGQWHIESLTVVPVD